MSRRRRKRPRTPEVLRRAYGCRVNSLEDVILSLLPTPPPDSPLDCSCNGRLCLGCLGQPYLVHDDAPVEFLCFLSHTFCVVSPCAPPAPANFCGPDLGLRNRNGFLTIRAINYCHAWDHLLERIGDELMTFLLRHSSIFVPLANRNYLQVTGDPLKDPKFCCQNVQKVGNFRCSQLLEVPADTAAQSLKNRGTKAINSSCHDVSENFSTFFRSRSRKRRREFSWKRRKKYKKLEEAVQSMTVSNLHAGYHETDHCSCNISEPKLLKDRFSFVKGISQEQHKQATSHCLDCIMVHCPSKAELGAVIRRSFMFYVRLSSESLFPKNHILNKLKQTNAGAISLLIHIFEVSANDRDLHTLFSSLNSTKTKIPCSCIEASGSKCLFHSLIYLLKALIRNCQRCQYKKLLWRHCVNPISNKNRSICHGSEVECNLIDSYATHHQVVSFIWAATRSLVPKDLLGDYINWRGLRKNISTFVRLRRFERFSLKQCMHRLKVSRYQFLSKSTFCNFTCTEFSKSDMNHRKRKLHLEKLYESVQYKLLRSWIYWYFSEVVVPLLGNNFYITERETRKQDVFYYARPIWEVLYKNTVSLLKKSNYRILDSSSLEKLLSERRSKLGGRTFGFSRVRLLPKEKNARPLANLKVPSKLCCTGKKIATIHGKDINVQRKIIWYKSVNTVLRELFVVLRSIKAEDPSKLGASVFDYNEIYQRLFQYKTGLIKHSEFFDKLYIVVADVAKAYDSMDQDMLIDIMNNIIPRDTYFFKHCSRFVCTNNSIKAIPYRLGSCHFNENHDIMKIEASIQLNSSCGVLIDKGTGDEVSSHMLHQVLTEHIKHNILQIGRDYYLQVVGITQGSVLSTLLCSFYFGYLERSVILPFLEKAYEMSSSTDKKERGLQATGDYANSFKPHNLLLRFVDDFLFISTSKQQATSFLSRMQRGFKSFNSYMNFEKFGFNFSIDGSSVSKRFYTGADGKNFIPWCGLLINTENFEIQADYTRYWGSHLSSTITVHADPKLGCTLQKKLCDYVRPKCYPLLYDSTINSLATVALNAYQAFLLSAMKFYCWARSMPSFNKLNPSYIADKLFFSFRYMYKLLRKRMHYVETRLNVKPVLKLRKKEFVWLGFSAYLRALKKKQSRHRELISLIWAKVNELDVDSTLPYLKYAVEDSHSSLFWKVKF